MASDSDGPSAPRQVAYFVALVVAAAATWGVLASAGGDPVFIAVMLLGIVVLVVSVLHALRRGPRVQLPARRPRAPRWLAWLSTIGISTAVILVGVPAFVYTPLSNVEVQGLGLGIFMLVVLCTIIYRTQDAKRWHRFLTARRRSRRAKEVEHGPRRVATRGAGARRSDHGA